MTVQSPRNTFDAAGRRAALDDTSVGPPLDDARDEAALLTMQWALDGFPETAGAPRQQPAVAAAHQAVWRRWEEEVQGAGQPSIRPVRDDVRTAWQRALEMAPQPGRGGALTGYFLQCAMHLPEILAGELAVQTLLFSDDAIAEEIYQTNPASRYTNAVAAAAIADHSRAVHAQGRTPAILEVGGGVGGTTDLVLDELTDLPIRYHFTDVGDWFLSRALQRWAGRSGLQVGHFDLNAPDAGQCGALAAEPEGFDAVLAANVMHNATDVVAALDVLAGACRPGASLVLIETGTEHLPLLISMRFLMSAPAGQRGFGSGQANRDRILLPGAEWTRAVELSRWRLDAVLPGPDETHPVARHDQHVWLATLPEDAACNHQTTPEPMRML